MEPQVGLVSGKLEEQEYGYAPGSRVYAGPDWGWQTQPSYQKTIDMRRGAAFFNFMSSLGEPIKQSLAPLAQQLAPVAEAVSGVVQATPIVGPFTEALGTTTETLRQEAVQRGLDPRFGDVAVMAGEELITAGLGKAVKAVDKVLPPPRSGPQLALATAAATPAPPSMSVAPSFEKGGLVMKAVTSQHAEALELTGRKTGEEIVGADVAIGKQLTKRKKDIQSVESDIKYYKEALEGLDELKGDPRNLRAFVGEDPDLSRLWNRYVEKYGPDKVFAKVRSKYAEQKANADTMWSRIKSNVLPFEKEGDYSKWYASSAAKPFKQKAEKILRARGELQIKEYLQQHHLIPKGMTAAYFDKMDQLIASGKAKLDDLVLMAEVAAAKGKPTGDVKVNIEDMIPKPHNEMHMVLRSQGAEVAKSKLIKDLSKVNIVDELMEKWVREFDPDGNFTYNYETAKVWEGLDKLLKELRGS